MRLWQSMRTGLSHRLGDAERQARIAEYLRDLDAFAAPVHLWLSERGAFTPAPTVVRTRATLTILEEPPADEETAALADRCWECCTDQEVRRLLQLMRTSCAWDYYHAYADLFRGSRGTAAFEGVFLELVGEADPLPALDRIHEEIDSLMRPVIRYARDMLQLPEDRIREVVGDTSRPHAFIPEVDPDPRGGAR